MIKTGAKDVESNNPLCQVYKEVGGNIEIRMPDKIAAVKELVRVYGWAKPDRLELSATDTLAEFITPSASREGLASEPGCRTWKATGFAAAQSMRERCTFQWHAQSMPTAVFGYRDTFTARTMAGGITA